MAITLRNTPWAEGTTVGAYDATGYDRFPASGPLGEAAETAVVSDSEVFFESLVDGVYFAAAKVGSEWRSIRFMPGEGFSGPLEDWHVVGDNGEPEFEKIETSQGPQQLWLTPGDPFPGAGSEWEPEPGSYQAEHKAWGVPRLAFYKDPLGVVNLRGGAVALANPYTLWDEGKAETPNWEEAGASDADVRAHHVFVLPVGYRPEVEIVTVWQLVVIEDGTIGGSASRPLTVLPSGLVLLGDHTEGGVGIADDLVRLDLLSFRAA